MFQCSVFTRFFIKQIGDDKCSKILFSKNKNFLSEIVVSFLRQSPYLCINTTGWLYWYVSVALCIDIVSIRTVSSQPYMLHHSSQFTWGDIHKASKGKPEVKGKLWRWITTKPLNITIFNDYGRMQIQFCISL